MFNKKTIKDIDIRGKTVLLRADYNVPLQDGQVKSDFRITSSLPTLQYLIEQNCKVFVVSHLGRPKSSDDTQFSLLPVAEELSKQLEREVQFVHVDITDDAASIPVATLQPADVALLENIRFYPEEKANDEAFAKQLLRVTGAEVFVQDGFGVVHRAHATTDAITRQGVPAVAGLLLEKECSTLNGVLKNPEKPMLAVIGGAKIADKLAVVKAFMSIADCMAIGGAMANTFLKAQGHDIGKSLYDAEEIDLAHDIIEQARAEAQKRNFVFYLPHDAVVAEELDSKTSTRIVDWDSQVVADIEAYPSRPDRKAAEVGEHEKILDIGPFSGSFIAGMMQQVSTVVWNGTMGVTEVDAINGPVGPFAHGTQLIIDGLLGHFGHRPFAVVGGGDTVGYLEERRITDMFNHVSTGGGASMDLLSGKALPGVEALEDKE